MSHVNVHRPVAPVHEDTRELGKRLAEISGSHIGFIDAMKPNAGLFLQYIERMLTTEFAGLATETVRKSLTPNMAAAHELEGPLNGVIVAWGD